MPTFAEALGVCGCRDQRDGFSVLPDGTAVHAGCGKPTRQHLAARLNANAPAKPVADATVQAALDAPAKTVEPIRVLATGTEAAEAFANRPRAIRRPSTKKRQPRLVATEAEIAAAEAKRTVPTPVQTEETSMTRISLSDLTDADLGRMVRSGLLTVALDEVAEAKPAADEAKAQAIAEARALLTTEQEARREAEPLAGFTVKGVDVPALDLSAHNVNEVVPAKARSPYNKARYRLGIPEVLDRETTTWVDLAAEHVRLAELAATVPAKAKATEQGAPEGSLRAAIAGYQRKERTHVWKGEPVTEGQYHQRLRLTGGKVPANSGPLAQTIPTEPVALAADVDAQTAAKAAKVLTLVEAGFTPEQAAAIVTKHQV